MKKIFVPFLIIVFLLSFVDDTTAQRRGKKKRPKKEDTEERSSTRDRREDDFEADSFADNLNYEIKMGNLNFFGNQLSISLKSNAGYKFNNTFSAGAGGKLFYDYINFPGSSSDISFFSYGGFLYGRAKLGQQFYLQGEYSMVSFGEDSFAILPRRTISYPSAGIGYMQTGFNWSYGFEIIAILNDEVRDRIGIVEYWFNFSKNF